MKCHFKLYYKVGLSVSSLLSSYKTVSSDYFSNSVLSDVVIFYNFTHIFLQSLDIGQEPKLFKINFHNIRECFFGATAVK